MDDMVDLRLPRTIAGYVCPMCPHCEKEYGTDVANAGPVLCGECGRWFEVTAKTGLPVDREARLHGRDTRSDIRLLGERRNPMTSRELLEGILQNLPENRLEEVLDFAKFLSVQEDRAAWQEFGRRQLAPRLRRRRAGV